MKITTRICQILTFLCLGTSLAIADPTGGSDGGGGGAFVCRDASTQAVKEVELLDLWETREISGQSIIYDNEKNIPSQIETAIAKLNKISSKLGKKARETWKMIQPNIVEASPSVVIDPPRDVGNHFRKEGCNLEGMMYFDDNRSRLIVKKELFDAQKTTTEKAASYFHEVVYKVLRKEYSVRNSVRARMLTGCAFSSDFEKCLNLQQIGIPESQNIWRCKNPEKDKYGYSSGLDPFTLIISQLGSDLQVDVESYKDVVYGYRSFTELTFEKNAFYEINTGDGPGYSLKSDEIEISGLESLVLVQLFDRISGGAGIRIYASSNGTISAKFWKLEEIVTGRTEFRPYDFSCKKIK